MADWSSYLWIFLLGALAILLRGFIGEVAKDLYSYMTRKISPPEPEPVEVDHKFGAKNYAPDDCRWVNKYKVEGKLGEGYSHYLDPTDGATRYRNANLSEGPPVIEFYMLIPNAKKLDDTN